MTALGSVTIASKAGEEGRLFGAITTRDVAEAVTAAGVEIAKSEVRYQTVQSALGDHDVRFQLHGEVFATLDVIVLQNNYQSFDKRNPT